MSWDSGLCETDPAFCFASSDATRIRAVAGPGTGKSYAMKRRIAHFIEQGTDPRRILAVTFTRTAAADLKREIISLDVMGADHVVAKTLHSLCFSILTREEVLLHLGRIPRPMVEHEIRPMIEDLADDRFGNVREKQKRLHDFEAAWARMQCDDPGYAPTEIDDEFERALNVWLTFHKSMLIGEIIPRTLAYLNDNPVCLERRLFDHVLVDEYQDLNKAEQVLIALLAGTGTITIVGDDDQSIYSFRNAHPEGIRVFPDVNPACVSINFDECRRCPSFVTEMASRLIQNNAERTLGTLAPRNGNDTGDVHIIQWNTLHEEIMGISDIIQEHLRIGAVCPGDVLVLTPRRQIGYQIRNRLLGESIPVRSYFRENALDSKETKQAFSMLNLAANPDDRVALRYLLGFGSQSYLAASYLKLQTKAQELGTGVREVLEAIMAGTLKLPHTSQIVASYIAIKAAIARIDEIVRSNPEGLVEYFCPNDTDLFIDLREALLSAIERVDSFESYDDRMQWLFKIYEETRELISMPEIPEDVDHVRIMSLHSSKGLSAKVVVICACIDEFIPSELLNVTETEKPRKLEEQRRLFYVAVTRCKNDPGVYPGTLILSSCIQMSGVEALQQGIPARVDQDRRLRASRFIRELGPRQPRSIYGGDYLAQLQGINQT